MNLSNLKEVIYVTVIIYVKPTDRAILKNTMLSPLRLETRQGCSFLPLLFNIILEALVSAKRKEMSLIGKEGRKPFIFGLNDC